MVNFYNDYLTCSKMANLSDVAGIRVSISPALVLDIGMITQYVSRDSVKYNLA